MVQLRVNKKKYYGLRHCNFLDVDVVAMVNRNVVTNFQCQTPNSFFFLTATSPIVFPKSFFLGNL